MSSKICTFTNNAKTTSNLAKVWTVGTLKFTKTAESVFNTCSTALRRRYSWNVARQLWGDMLVPLRLICDDHLRVISAQHPTGAQQTMETKENVGQNRVIRTARPIAQQTANSLFRTATDVKPAARNKNMPSSEQNWRYVCWYTRSMRSALHTVHRKRRSRC